MKARRLDRDDVLGVGIDLQERLIPAMAGKEALEAAWVKWINGLRTLGVPVIVSQQYTKGLGETIPSVREALASEQYFEKRSFSAMGAEAFRKAVKDSGKKTILIFGIESHVCMQQTALDLMEEGYRVYVIEDACSSRSLHDHEMSMRRLAQAGAVITTFESALFELLDTSESPDFKAISAIVK